MKFGAQNIQAHQNIKIQQELTQKRHTISEIVMLNDTRNELLIFRVLKTNHYVWDLLV
jgi:hypothetical protein